MQSTVDKNALRGLGDLGIIADDRALPRLIAEKVAHAIVDGSLSPGQRLAEVELAELFGTSRTPVREALQLLSHEGLVELIPRRGARVVQLSPEGVHGAYVCRAAIFGLASRLVAEHANPGEHRTLEVICADMERHLSGADVGSFFDSCIEFGDEVLSMAAVPHLTQLARSLRGAAAFSLDRVSVQSQRASVVLDHYRSVVDAIEFGRSYDADQAMRRVQAEFGDWLVATQFDDRDQDLVPIATLVVDSAKK